jgi:hypothetical protein
MTQNKMRALRGIAWDPEENLEGLLDKCLDERRAKLRRHTLSNTWFTGLCTRKDCKQEKKAESKFLEGSQFKRWALEASKIHVRGDFAGVVAMVDMVVFGSSAL